MSLMPLQRLPRSRLAGIRGFTLVELLVAVFVLAIMAAMAWRGLDAVLRARETTSQRFDQLQRLTTTITQLKRDSENLASFASSLPAIAATADGGLRLWRLAASGEAERYVLLHYRLRENRFERGVSDPLDDLEAAQPRLDGSEPPMHWVTLLEPVSRFSAQAIYSRARGSAEPAWQSLTPARHDSDTSGSANAGAVEYSAPPLALKLTWSFAVGAASSPFGVVGSAGASGSSGAPGSQAGVDAGQGAGTSEAGSDLNRNAQTSDISRIFLLPSD